MSGLLEYSPDRYYFDRRFVDRLAAASIFDRQIEGRSAILNDSNTCSRWSARAAKKIAENAMQKLPFHVELTGPSGLTRFDFGEMRQPANYLIG
jgi:hypothetical protein